MVTDVICRDEVHGTLVLEFYPISAKLVKFITWRVRNMKEHVSCPTIKGSDKNWIKIEFITSNYMDCLDFKDILGRGIHDFKRNTSSPRKPHKRPGRAAKIARKQRADARKGGN